MQKFLFTLAASLFTVGAAMAEPDAMTHHAMHAAHDPRISLDLSPDMKQHQLANMRSHVLAIQTIIGHLAQQEYEPAAQVAQRDLGLSDEMRKMCSTMSSNAQFSSLGLAFHQSGDALGLALRSKNMQKSLQALHTTLNYCVECHATFRQ